MNTIDFSQPGGFPLTQDILSTIQSTYVDGLTGLASVIDDGSTPVIISGMNITHPSGGTAVSDGWFYYRGQLIQFTSSSLGVLSGGIVPLVLITNSSNTLTFNNGSTPSVLFTQTAQLIAGTPLTDATHFVLSDIVPFIIQIGRLGRESSFTSITSTTSAASGGVFWLMEYKKNYITNTVHLRFSGSIAHPENFATSASYAPVNLGTLPSGYRPVSRFPFRLWIEPPGSSRIVQDTGVNYMEEINCWITNGGIIIADFRKSAALSGGTYIQLQSSTIMPLD